MDFIEILYKASEQNLCLDMNYTNLSGNQNRHIISDLKLDKKYKSFTAYSFQYKEVLNFKIERIKDIKILSIENSPLLTLGTGTNAWTHIFSINAKAPQSGIYVIACRGDNHLIFEFYHIKKDECFWSFFTGENEHCNSWSVVDPLAFHFVPYFNRNTKLWSPFEGEKSPVKEHFVPKKMYIRVFIENNEQKENQWIDDGTFLYTGINQIGNYNDLSQSSCIYYDVTNFDNGENFLFGSGSWASILFIKEDISKKKLIALSEKEEKDICYMGKKYLAYHCISKFSDVDHSQHWYLYEMLKNAK